MFPRVSGQSLFLPPLGDYTVLITQSLSAKAVVLNLEQLGTKADLEVINNGVKKASRIKPHSEDLP